MTQSPPQILDVTVRDGSFLINHQYTPAIVAKIALGLQEAGVEYAEVSHGCGIGGQALGFPALVDDEELLSAAKNAAPNLKFSIFISPIPLALSIIPGLLDFFEIGRVGLNLNQIRDGEKFIQKLKKYHKTVSIQLVRTHARPPEFAAKAAKQVYEMGADIIYVVDSFGSMKPNEAVEYVEAVKINAKVEVGFHSHNNLGFALANTVAAWKAGATWLDASLMGVGRSAGNTILEALVFGLKNGNQCQQIDLKKLFEITDKTILPLFGNPPKTELIDLLFALEKLDFISPRLLELSASMLRMPLEDLLRNIHNKMGEDMVMKDTHLKAVFEEEGVDFDQIISSLSSQNT